MHMWWKIWKGLEEDGDIIAIEADTFDEALAQAREQGEGYDSGQPMTYVEMRIYGVGEE